MSKGEIFQSKGITPTEKRLLMKFMQVTLPSIRRKSTERYLSNCVGGNKLLMDREAASDQLLG